MNKLIYKFFIIFVLGVSCLFFALVTFQKHAQERQFEMGYNSIPFDNPPLIIPVILIGALCVLFIYFILKYLDKNFINPLITIQNNLKKVKNGSYDFEFSIRSENETIQETFITLNEMVKGLKEKEKLQESFIQKIAHDLRTPIIAQDRALNILKEELKDHELIEGLINNSETYLKMINLILEANSENYNTINKIEFDFYKLTNIIFKTLKPLADKKNIALINNVPINFKVCCDYISMNRIIMNLVSNAIENLENNKEITLSAFDDNSKIQITVLDNGKGIKEENLKYIFDKYKSYTTQNNKTVNGLGLYITKELVEKNNGTIQVKSKLNEYTEFLIELPKDNNEKI